MPSASPTVARLVASALVLFTLCSLSSRVDAQLLDPSVPSAGMGGATVAAFWLDQPNVWINPALAGFQRGITYSYGSTDLGRSFAFLFNSQPKFQTHQILLGARGIGVEITGKPIESLGRLRLDYGPTQITDENGFPIGEASFIEDVRTFAIGVDVVALLASFQEASSGEPAPIRERLSIALGHAWNDWEVALEPDFGFQGQEEHVKNLGALVRFAALDQIGSTLGEATPSTRFRLELAGGYAKQDWEEEVFLLSHYGASARLTIATPTDGEGWLTDFGSPAIGVGLLWTSVDQGGSQNRTLFGAEATIFDILYLRGGLVEDYFLDGFFGFPELRTEASFGGGLKLQYRKMLGARFDYASYPASAFSDFDRFQGSVFVDPIRLWRSGR